jgi:hypothetical protein
MAGYPPSGTVTFLLTDLEGSTRLWEQEPASVSTSSRRSFAKGLEQTPRARRGRLSAIISARHCLLFSQLTEQARPGVSG